MGVAIRSAGRSGHFWLANAASGTVTTYIGDVYDEDGNFVPLFQDDLTCIAVNGSPIGQVFSSSAADFPVTGSLCTDDAIPTCDAAQASYLGEFTGPSRFVVATEEGQIAAWTEGRINDQFGRMRAFVTLVDHAAGCQGGTASGPKTLKSGHPPAHPLYEFIRRILRSF